MKTLDIKNSKTPTSKLQLVAMMAAAAAPSMTAPWTRKEIKRRPWSCSAKGLQKRKDRSRMQKLSRRANR